MMKESTMAERLLNELGNDFWTNIDELVSDIEDYGYRVQDANDEYITVVDDADDDEEETLLYLGHANRTIWVENVKNF